MISKELLAEFPQNFVAGDDPMGNLRKNLFLYVDSPKISIRDIADAADIPMATLNSILYGSCKDCHMRTVIALAKGLGISVDELMGI